MTESGDRIDRYVRGELSATEARELAQASLDPPELFDELTDSALVKAALFSGNFPSGKLVRFPRKTWSIAAVAAAAAIVLISLGVVKPWRTASPQPKPALAFSATTGQPLLLASGLQPTQTPVFRGSEIASRAPLLAGSIVSIEGGLATINLGSLDGLAKGGEVQVLRGDRSIGRLQVTAVFRESARGRILDGPPVRVKDQVRVDGAAHVSALLEQVDALYNRGDREAAYQMAEQGSRWAETANVPPLERSAFWNTLAVFQILRGDYEGAEAPLKRAASALPNMTTANNLGVLAELRGDRRRAESLYADALRASAGATEDRRAVEANLTRVRGSH